jgi:multiple sugar transport system permease protein
LEQRLLFLQNRLFKSDYIRKGARFIKKKLPSWVWAAIRFVFLGGLSFIVIYPILVAFSVSLRSEADIIDPSVLWIPKHPTLDNLKYTMRIMKYVQVLITTVKLDVVSSLLQVVSCALVGYGFARFKFKFKPLLFGLVVFTIIVPPQVTFVPTYLTYNTLKLLDTPLVMYLPALLGVGIRSGLFIFIFRQFYRNLPRELEDAALVDGCGVYKTYLRIIIPNAKPAFLTVFLFSIVWYWNDYYNATMYFKNVKTVTTALDGLVSAVRLDSQSGIIVDPYLLSTVNQAGCLLAIFPVLVIYIIFHRFFTEGVERTGIVG